MSAKPVLLLVQELVRRGLACLLSGPLVRLVVVVGFVGAFIVVSFFIRLLAVTNRKLEVMNIVLQLDDTNSLLLEFLVVIRTTFGKIKFDFKLSQLFDPSLKLGTDVVLEKFRNLGATVVYLTNDRVIVMNVIVDDVHPAVNLAEEALKCGHVGRSTD
jgi:hypothetical protein